MKGDCRHWILVLFFVVSSYAEPRLALQNALTGAETSSNDESSLSEFFRSFLPSFNKNNVDKRAVTKGEDCYRKCDGKPKICYYDWTLERYSVLGPACRNCSNGVLKDCFSPQCVVTDGFQRGILTMNREFGGPSIQVCKNDLIVIDVHNEIPEEATSIHWHGFRQRKTPYMDGVPMVTQCPIQPFTTFTYAFEAEEAGTFFWHSHLGSQKLDGLNGPLIVRQEKGKELHSSLYDEDLKEHVIFIQDWTHLPADQYTPGIHSPPISQVPDAVLINGLGRFSINGSNPNIPVGTFYVESGKKYRFRVIGGSCMTCAYALTIRNHKLTAISADGGLNFKPTQVDSIAVNSADRFDFILEANQPPGAYYIFVQTVNSFCSNIRQVAVLQYTSSGNSVEGSSIDLMNPPPTGELGLILNLPNSTCSSDNSSEICISMLKGEMHAPSIQGSNNLYKQYQVRFGDYLYELDDLFQEGTYQRFEEPAYERYVRYVLNNISFQFPPSPMYTQFKDITTSLCEPQCYTENIQKSCVCTNVNSVPKQALVDIIIIDTGERDGFNHPFHLHGYNYYVLEMGTFGENKAGRQKEIDEISERARNDKVNLRFRPQRDTISVPSRGYVVIRFISDNPGYWLLHCHFLYHLESGMAEVLKVGEERDMPRAPKHFPRCGDFKLNFK